MKAVIVVVAVYTVKPDQTSSSEPAYQGWRIIPKTPVGKNSPSPLRRVLLLPVFNCFIPRKKPISYFLDPSLKRIRSHPVIGYRMSILKPPLNTKPSVGAHISGKVGLLVGGKTKGSKSYWITLVKFSKLIKRESFLKFLITINPMVQKSDLANAYLL